MPSTAVTIRNDPAEILVVRSALDRFASEHKVPRGTVVELQVVLDELVSNVMKYAWPEGGAHQLVISMSVLDAHLEVEIVDDGRPYDPRQAPAPVLGGGKRQPGGLGLHIVKQLVDSFDYERSREHNRVRVTKRLILEPDADRGTQ